MMCRCPEITIGKYKGCSIILKSYNPVEDSAKFEAAWRDFYEIMQDIIDQPDGEKNDKTMQVF